jgi:hypothetical protein
MTVMIAQIVRDDPSLTECDLSFFNMGFNAISWLSDGLRTNRYLSKLTLGSVEARHKFGDAGGKALAGALKVNTTLTELNLDSCGLKDITELADTFKVIRSLLVFSLKWNKLGDAGGKALAGALKVNATLTVLDLWMCDLENITELVNALRVNRSLSKLDLGGNKFGDAGGKALAGALKVNTTLTELGLQNCDLRDITDLANTLKVNRSLSKLRLGRNQIGDAGVKALAGALTANTALNELNLWDCGFKNITELADVLKSNRSLSILSLEQNKFGNAGGKALAGALKVNTTLTQLHLFTVDVDEEVLSQIKAKLSSNRKLANQRKLKDEKEWDAKRAAVMPSQSLAKGQPQLAANSQTAASATAVGNKATAAALIDGETLEKVKGLPEKHEALSRQVQKLTIIDAASLEVLQERTGQLFNLLETESKAAGDNQEKALIKANPQLQIYYRFFARLLNGTWMACQTINSGMVGNAESYKSDYVGQGLDQIGQRIPGISIITGFFSGAIKAWNYREKQKAVQRMAMFFLDLETAFSQLGQLARQVTLAQGKQICSMPAPQGLVDKVKEGIKDAAAFLMGADADTPLKRKAEEDCKKLLEAIKDGKLPQHPTVEDLVAVIMGAGFKYQPPTQSPVSPSQPKVNTPSSPSAASPVTPQSQEVNISIMEMAEELRKMKLREAEREAELKKIQEKMAKVEAQLPPDESVEFGDDAAQLKLSKSKHAATAASATATGHQQTVAELLDAKNRHEAEIAALKAKQNEHADGLDTSKAEIGALKARKAKNETCSIC